MKYFHLYNSSSKTYGTSLDLWLKELENIDINEKISFSAIFQMLVANLKTSTI